MSAYQLYERAIKRRPLYALACYLGMSLAAFPSQAAPRAGHRTASNPASPTVRPHGGSFPNPSTNDVDSYHINYTRPSKEKPATVIVSMHLDAYEEIKDGSGSFQKQIPQGRVRVKWHRGMVQLYKDEYGGPIDSEHEMFPVYALIIDAPKALPVQLRTQQYGLITLRLNGHLVQPRPYLSGEVAASGPSDDQRLGYTVPGGHNVLILRMDYRLLNE